jgi:hypothetical protein
MLPSSDDLKQSILNLSPSKDAVSGVTAFVKVIADFTNMVQGGPLGTPGILTFGNEAMIAMMLQMQPVKDASWIPKFADAWEEGILTSIITPGTISNPAIWLGSIVDVATLPTAAATILTLPAAKAVLTAELANVKPDSNAPLPLATAIRDATLALVFNAIGLGPPPTFTPIPVPTSAE